jgi:glycerol-3-phosphate dehydrogenase
MAKIIRDPAACAKKTYDLIIIGGGIYGVMLAFEASKRDLKSLLLEKADFGGATTFNCLRIIHGGFRYLQNLDLHRFRESAAERRWFLKTFPGLVEPLPCLMPLYGSGLRRPSVLGVATWINDTLSRNRNINVESERHIPNCKILDAEETKRITPLIDSRSLQGGVIWYDAIMSESQRIVIETLCMACEMGTTALNYVEANELIRDNSATRGVLAKDLECGETHEYNSEVVINAAGPWSRVLAAKFDRDEPSLFKSSIAWNVLFDRPSISTHALAVTPRKPMARTYFLLPWQGKLLAGTGHAPWFETAEDPKPSRRMLQKFVDDINLAIPEIDLNTKDILRVFSGLLPVKKLGTVDLLKSEIILNHSDQGGPKGLYSVSGVKFTTSHLVAEKTINKIFTEYDIKRAATDDSFGRTRNERYQRGIFNLKNFSFSRIEELKTHLISLIEEESVRNFEDLIFRRTNLWEYPAITNIILPHIRYYFQGDVSQGNGTFKKMMSGKI